MGVDAPGVAMRAPRPTAARLASSIDVVLVVVAAVVAIVAGAPVLGAVLGAGVWLLQRVVQLLDRRWAQSMRTPHQQVTVDLFERFGRIWLLAGGIIASGLIGGRRDGLTTALFVFGAYTVAFVIKLFSGRPPEPEVHA